VCAVCRARFIRVRLSVAIAIVASHRAARSVVMCDFPRATIHRSAGCGPLALAHSPGPLVAIRPRLLFKGRAAAAATVAFLGSVCFSVCVSRAYLCPRVVPRIDSVRVFERSLERRMWSAPRFFAGLSASRTLESRQSQ